MKTTTLSETVSVKMLLFNVDSDVIAVPKDRAIYAPFLGDVIDEKTGVVVSRLFVQAEWESPWMKYTPMGELTEMTPKTFKVTASKDSSAKVAGEHVRFPQRGDYPQTVEKFSDIVCKTLDLAAFADQYKDNHALNVERHVVVAVYAIRRVEGGFRIIAYLPAVLNFRTKNLAQVIQCHPPLNLDLRMHTDLHWMHAEFMDVLNSVERAIRKKRFSTVTIHGMPRYKLEHLQKLAGCALEIFSWNRKSA